MHGLAEGRFPVKAANNLGAYADSFREEGSLDMVTGIFRTLGLPRMGWVEDPQNLGCGVFELAHRQTRLGCGWVQVPDWMHALVLASLVHPDPPAELLAHASVILATGYVEVVS